VPVSLIYPLEPWNNFWYANAALFPAIALAGHLSERSLAGKSGKPLVVSFMLYLFLSMALFLAGPKWYYPSLDGEISYIGKMNFYLNEDLFRERGFLKARDITDKAVKELPGSSVAYYYKGLLASGEAERRAAFEKALRIDPGNTLVRLYNIDSLIESGRWREANERLKTLLITGNDRYYQVYTNLADAREGLGDLEKAEEYLLKALELKPDKFDLYERLFFIRQKMGKAASAERALDMFASKYFEDPYIAYLRVAARFALEGDLHRSAVYAEKAKEAILGRSDRGDAVISGIPEMLTRLGNILLSIGKEDEAVEVLKKAIEVDPGYARAYHDIALAYYNKEEYDEAYRYCELAIGSGHPMTPSILEILSGKERSR
jgi:tetratricopeptide (TPR) repeat protein